MIADNVGVIANKVFALVGSVVLRCSGPACSRSRSRSTPTSPPTPTSRAARRAGSGFELTENFDHPYLARDAVGLLAPLEHLALVAGSATTSTCRSAVRGRGSWPGRRNVLITFLLSGLWHGASWNYVLWGLYHGLLLILTRAHTILRPASSPRWVTSPSLRLRLLVVLQIAGMFVLTNIGWLLFRETSLAGDRARPDAVAVRRVSRSIVGPALYLFLLTFVYSIPLWVQSVWVEVARHAHRAQPHVRPWPRLVWQGVACGLAFAAILVLRSRTSLDFIYFQF